MTSGRGGSLTFSNKQQSRGERWGKWTALQLRCRIRASRRHFPKKTRNGISRCFYLFVSSFSQKITRKLPLEGTNTESSFESFNLELMSTLPDFWKFGETSFSKVTRSQPNKSHLRIMGSVQQKKGLNGVMAFTANHQNFGYLVRIMVNIIVNDVNHYVNCPIA